MHGGDVDDAAGLLGVAQLADEGLGEKERALQVHVEDGIVVLLGDVPESGALLDAGVVDEDVAAAELLPRLVNEVLGVSKNRDVGPDHDGFAARDLDLAASAFGGVDVVAVVDDAVGTLLGEAFGDCLADAGAGAGDDGDFSLE